MSKNTTVSTSLNNANCIVENTPIIVFTEARLIDGTGSAAKEKQTVVIRNGRISSIGADGSIDIPKEAKRISLEGKSLLPGWVMVNEHLYSSDRGIEFEKHSPYQKPRSLVLTQQPISYPRLYLAAGVTSARTSGNIEPYSDLNIKKNIDAGHWVGPDFDLTAPYLDGEPGELQMKPLKDGDDARAFVRYWASEGYTSFHIYEDITREQMAAAIEEAHQLGLSVAFHTALNVTTRDALELGATHLTHGLLELLWDLVPDEVLKNEGLAISQAVKKAVGSLMARKDLLSPTDPRVKDKVQDSFRFLMDHQVSVQSVYPVSFRTALPEDVVALFNQSGQDSYHRDGPISEAVDVNKLDHISQRIIEMELAFWEAGGLLTVGTEAGRGLIAGYTNLRGIELLVISGFPPLAAIQIATENGAKALGIADDRGTIQLGKRADLIVVNGNPSEDITDIYNIETVFKNGIGYDAKALKDSVKGMVRGPS